MSYAGMAIGGALGVANYLNTEAQADQLKQEAKWQANQLRFNAQMSDLQSDQVLKYAEFDVQDMETQVRSIIGEQKVSAASQGIEVESEVVQNLRKETMRAGVKEAQTIRSNAWKESFGLKLESMSMRQEAKFSQMSASARAKQMKNQAILQGVGQVAQFGTMGF